MWAWLNPLNLIKLFGLVKSLRDSVIAFLEWLKKYQAEKTYADSVKKNEEIRKKAENADTPEETQDAANDAAAHFGRHR